MRVIVQWSKHTVRVYYDVVGLDARRRPFTHKATPRGAHACFLPHPPDKTTQHHILNEIIITWIRSSADR